jgi:adenylate cyclase class IV
MMSNESDTLRVLNDILVWTKVGFYATAKAMIIDVLNSDKKKLAYQAADGKRSGDSIRLEMKMSPNDLSDLFKLCTSVGLMEQIEGGKRRRLFDLANFGLLPPPPSTQKETKVE